MGFTVLNEKTIMIQN